MPPGTEVGFVLRDLVLDGDPGPAPKRGRSPIPNFRPIFIVAKRLDASDGDPAPSPKAGGAPNFWPISIAAKRLHGS